MNECVRLIIGGDRGIEERGVRGRWIDLIQTNLGGREGTAVLGTKRGRSLRLPSLPSSENSYVALNPDAQYPGFRNQ